MSTVLPRYQVKRARREWACRVNVDRYGRRTRFWDGGSLPSNHHPLSGEGVVGKGEQYVQWQQYGETQRCCETCARAAGLL